jgi:hypothetical protein
VGLNENGKVVGIKRTEKIWTGERGDIQKASGKKNARSS